MTSSCMCPRCGNDFIMKMAEAKPCCTLRQTPRPSRLSLSVHELLFGMKALLQQVVAAGSGSIETLDARGIWPFVSSGVYGRWAWWLAWWRRLGVVRASHGRMFKTQQAFSTDFVV